MKNKKIILRLLIILAVIGSSFYFVYLDFQTKKINQDFVFDTIRVLRKVHDSRGLGLESENLLEEAYLMKQEIGESKKIIDPWTNDHNSLRKDISVNFLAGLNELDLASDAYIRFVKNPTDEDFVIFKVKLDAGTEELLSIALLSVEGNAINLSGQQKREILDYIDIQFKDELDNFREKGKEEGFTMQKELWAMVLLHGGLSK